MLDRVSPAPSWRGGADQESENAGNKEGADDIRCEILSNAAFFLKGGDPSRNWFDLGAFFPVVRRGAPKGQANQIANRFGFLAGLEKGLRYP